MIFSKVYSSNQTIWEEKETILFNELILSWNGIRPKQGKWIFWVGIGGEWLKYAEWGPNYQKTFKSVGSFAESNQDIVLTKNLCNHFKIKVEGEDLSQLHSMSVCLSNLANYKLKIPSDLSSVMLKDVPRQSQLTLDHPRSKDLCSPTATTTAMSYLCKKKFDPVSFANFSHDDEFDIHGNWVLNVAESYNQTQLPCHVERLSCFIQLHAQLLKGRPCVVSIKGALAGAPKIYEQGHLICVIGFDNKQVYCIDSNFKDNESTFIGYEVSDFLKAWALRYNLAYVYY